MRTTDTPALPCWNCGQPNDAVSDLVGDAVPTAGDLSFCIMCAAPSIFIDETHTRKPTDVEIQEILQDEEAVLHMLAIAMLHGVPVLAILGMDAEDHQHEYVADSNSTPKTEGMRFV